MDCVNPTHVQTFPSVSNNSLIFIFLFLQILLQMRDILELPLIIYAVTFLVFKIKVASYLTFIVYQCTCSHIPN